MAGAGAGAGAEAGAGAIIRDKGGAGNTYYNFGSAPLKPTTTNI